MVNQERLNYLLEQVRIAKIKADECEELIQLTEAEDSEEIIHWINTFYEGKEILSASGEPYNFSYWQSAVREILDADKTEDKIKDRQQRDLYPSPVAQVYSRQRIRRWAVAAVLIGLIACGTYIFFNARKQASPIAVTRVTDLPPGSNKAVLTLANGQQVILDNTNKGAIASQGSAQVIKLDSGLLAYNKTGKGTEEVLYNLITTPRGGQYQLILPDGSHVWLNAASSLRYPTAFVGKQRQVELSGEAYFEVIKNARQPFLVKTSHVNITVLGTHFNIMAYGEESLIQTTLAEGSVQVSNVSGSVLISPGQQASFNKSGNQHFTVAQANLEEVLAWKNGQILLSNVNVPAIMRQISRWYDVDISYSGGIPDKSFSGMIDRNVPLSDVLKVLDAYNLHCRLDPDKKLVVLP